MKEINENEGVHGEYEGVQLYELNGENEESNEPNAEDPKNELYNDPVIQGFLTEYRQDNYNQPNLYLTKRVADECYEYIERRFKNLKSAEKIKESRLKVLSTLIKEINDTLEDQDERALQNTLLAIKGSNRGDVHYLDVGMMHSSLLERIKKVVREIRNKQIDVREAPSTRGERLREVRREKEEVERERDSIQINLGEMNTAVEELKEELRTIKSKSAEDIEDLKKNLQDQISENKRESEMRAEESKQLREILNNFTENFNSLLEENAQLKAYLPTPVSSKTSISFF